MGLAVLHLNDLNLFIQTDKGQTYSEVGYALLTDKGIKTGDSARASTWLQPQRAYNQFWDQLNQTPFPVKHTYARHNADIAYAQLKHLLQSVNNPEQLILAIPGHIKDQQLSLLLGLLRALEVEVIGTIDSAVVAANAYPEAQYIVELHLYQTVITVIDRKQSEIKIIEQRFLPDVGILSLYNQVAGLISQQLIDQHRYDPLHSSATEQQIYDLIPSWLQALSQESAISVQIESPQGELSTVIKKQSLAKLFMQRLDSLSSHLKGMPESVFFSHDAGFIPNLVSDFSGCYVLDQSIIFKNCLQFAHQFPKDRIERITQIYATQGTDDPSKLPLNKQQISATHLLYNNTAYSLHRPISISRQGKQLVISSNMDKTADLVIEQKGHQLQATSQHDKFNVTLPSNLDPGQKLQIDDQFLILIGVDHG